MGSRGRESYGKAGREAASAVDAVAAMVEAGWDIASHGYRWVDHFGMPEEVEREHIRRVIEIHERVVG